MTTRRRKPAPKPWHGRACGECRGLSPTRTCFPRSNAEAELVRRERTDEACKFFDERQTPWRTSRAQT
jgi:hypothetical protein